MFYCQKNLATICWSSVEVDSNNVSLEWPSIQHVKEWIISVLWSKCIYRSQHVENKFDFSASWTIPVETTNRTNITILDLAVREQQGVGKYMLGNRRNLWINIVIYREEILTDDSLLGGGGDWSSTSLVGAKRLRSSVLFCWFLSFFFLKEVEWQKDWSGN